MPSNNDDVGGVGTSQGGGGEPITPEQMAKKQREKRKLRMDYRKLIKETENVRANMADHNAMQLSQMIRDGTEMYQRVEEASEGVLDSKFLLNASELGTQFARTLKVNTGFEIEDYLKKCAAMLGGNLMASGRNTDAQQAEAEEEEEELESEDWDWQKMGRKAAKRTRRAPTFDFLLGPLAVEDKKRNVGRRAPVERSGPVVQPQQLNHDDIIKSENETTKMVRSVWNRLQTVNGHEGVNFFQFALDPTSFSNSVENIFYLSFLVRDGQVSIDDVDGEPILTSVEKPSEADYQNGLTKNQLVMEFDVRTWKDLIKVYNIQTSTIPSRSAPTNGGDTWTR